MYCILRKLPENSLSELFCNWLLVVEISALDCALCCNKYSIREDIWRIISESSRLFPLINSYGSYSLTYWSWLVQRNLCVKMLYFCDSDDLETVVSNVNPSIINKMKEQLSSFNENDDKISSYLNTSFNILNHIQELYFAPEVNKSLSIRTIENYDKLSIIFTNLKILSFDDACDINDIGLSSMLETNYHCLVKLVLRRCHAITGTNILPSLFSNIKELEIYYCTCLEENGWNIISSGFNNISNLKLHLNKISIGKSLLNLTQLTSLDVVLQKNTNNLSAFLPVTLQYLTILAHDLDDAHFKQLLSNNLHNLIYLDIKSDFRYDGGYQELLKSAPLLPQSLTYLNLSSLHIKLSMFAVVQLFSSNMTNL
eukprot:gene15580-21041_t